MKLKNILTINLFSICMLFAGVSGLHAQGVEPSGTLGGKTEVTTTTETKVTVVKNERILKSANERARDITENMRVQLKLTDDQVSKVYAINLAAAQKMDGLRKKHRSDISKLYRESLDVNKEQDQMLSNVLTPNQWAMYRRGKAKQ